MPALRGLDLPTATENLTKLQLAVGTVTQAYDDDVETGKVISSSVDEGTPLKPGTAVDLLLSQGPAPVTMADWTNKSAKDATAALKAQGLKVTTEQQNNAEVDKGDVISQTPPAGEVHRGDTVTLLVSKGPVLKAVPNVRGYYLDRAREILTKAGFEVKVNRLISFGFDRVVGTTPGAGKKVPEGSTVTVNLA
ncbi:MAG: PASTA domain-containing protein [Micropruina sp.]|nr:PASTA domain-containing protein [Micropruina sp.]